MRRIIGIAAVGALAASGLGLTGPAQAIAPHSAAQAAKTVKTTIGMEAHSFGTRVDKNPAVASGPTANSIIACTTLAGLTRSNNIAGVDVDPAVTANEVKSRNTTRKDGGTVTVTSRNTITSGSLLGGAVRFRGLSSESRTWRNASGFHNRVTMDLARLVVDGNPVVLTGGMQTVPVSNGLATLTVFQRVTRNSGRDASARGVVLKLEVLTGTDTGARVRVGSSYSHMYAGVRGPMSGSTWGTFVKLGNAVRSGRTAFQVMPCPGTRGVVRENPTVDMTPVDNISATGIATQTFGVQGPTVQRGYTRAEIADATIGAAPAPILALSGIVSKANVKRDNGTLTRNAKGTALATITLAGIDIRDRLQPNQPLDLSTLPGGLLDGTITFKKVTKVKNGIDVIAVLIVLNGVGADPDTRIELGHSIMKIKKS